MELKSLLEPGTRFFEPSPELEIRSWSPEPGSDQSQEPRGPSQELERAKKEEPGTNITELGTGNLTELGTGKD